MKNRAPIQDAIDRRNFKQDLASTVIKRRRVNFISAEEDEQLKEEEEILERIMAQNEICDEEPDFGYDEMPDMIPEEEPELDLSDIPDDVMSHAEEILARLQREAEEDEEARRQEWLAKMTNGEI